MKLDTHGIRFRFWLVFLLLAIGITVFIGILQVGLISPYYRNAKINAVSTVADNVIHDIVDDGSVSGTTRAMREATENDVCLIIYNKAGRSVYEEDSLGSGCIFHTESFSQDKKLGTPDKMIQVLTDNKGTYSVNMVNTLTNQEMIIYGKEVHANLADYYIFVNSPLEPVDSVVSFFIRQYFWYTVLAIALASLVAFYASRQITDPIVKMKKEANKLAHADYSASFDGGSFTETRELADTLNQADQKLGKIDELRRDLIANVSHDIRTPLTDIRAYAEMIRDISGDNKEKREKHLNVIIHETEYMSNLINDMSELSAMQSGNFTAQKENMDLVEKIHEIAEMDMPLIEKSELKLVIDTPDTLTIYADPIKIGQVIANYLSNAIKHSPKGHTVTIRAFMKKDEETVRLEVQDEGEGIPDSELPYIWDRYQKSSRTFRRDMHSTGLGLAIVKAIADAHQGKCGVETKVGEGSTFWFELRETHEA